MTYNIDWQSGGSEGIPGKTDILLPPKTIDSTSTTLALTGKGVPNYGEIQQENFLRLMEHFSSENAPQNPTIGQIWFNTGECILYMRVDPAVVGEIHPRYFPESPAAWVQIWPGRNAFASLAEYNALAITINRIIGPPSAYGSLPSIEDNQWGWGQQDLVPEFLSMNELKPEYTTYGFPPQFDNDSWAILLSRLRKALRYIEGGDVLTTPLVSPVGFIEDGRPAAPGNTIANTYNNNPLATLLPDYTPGWTNMGYASMGLHYASTLAAVSTLSNNRFKMATASTETGLLVDATRTDPWETTVGHVISIQFTDQDTAKAYFNSGGSLQFDMVLDAPGVNTISGYWANWLAYINGFHFDYKGIRYGNNYLPTPAFDFIGFYDLDADYQLIYQKRRDLAIPLTSYLPYLTDILDSGIIIEARASTMPGGEYQIDFYIRFVESNVVIPPDASPGTGFVSGILTSGIVSYNAVPLNMDTPGIEYPAGFATPIDLIP